MPGHSHARHYFLLRFPLRFLAVGNNHCDALRAEILEEIKCGNYGLTLQKLDHALFPPKISSKISCVSNKNYPGPNIINSQILQFLIIKIGTFIIEQNIDNDRGTDTSSFCPGNRSRGYGDTDSLYGWQIDHIVPQSLLRDRGRPQPTPSRVPSKLA